MAVPFPCRHCGFNYMKGVHDEHGLCNNCTEAEKRRNPVKGEKKVEHIEILVKCPKEAYAKIEEYCLNNGQDFSPFIIYAALEKLEPKKTHFQEQLEEAREMSLSEEQPKKKAKK